MKPSSGVWRRLALFCGAFFLQQASAQDARTGGFVTQSLGEVSYQAGEKLQPLPAFARLPSGTRIALGDGARLQIVYLRSGRQESWIGKTSIAVGDDESKSSGSVVPVVKVLQPYLIETLTKSRQVMDSIHDRQGMIRVRSLVTAAKAAEVESRYGEMRAQAAEDDITPEIYLLTALDGLKAYQRMRKPLAEMLRRQPDNAEARALNDHFMLLLNTGALEAPSTEPMGQ